MRPMKRRGNLRGDLLPQPLDLQMGLAMLTFRAPPPGRIAPAQVFQLPNRAHVKVTAVAERFQVAVVVPA